MAREGLDSSVDRVPVGDHCADQLAGEYGGFFVSFGLSEVAFQDRAGGPLAELGLEDRGERQPSSGPLRPLSVGGASHGSALGAHTVDDDGDALRLIPSNRSTAALTADLTSAASGMTGWPGRAMTDTRTRRSCTRARTALPENSRRHGGPACPTR